MRTRLWESVKHSSEFKKITRTGKKFTTPFFICFKLKSIGFKLGVVASKKVGCAVQRNKAKRVLRSAFSDVYKVSSNTIVLIAKHELLNAKYSEIKIWLEKTIEKSAIKYHFD